MSNKPVDTKRLHRGEERPTPRYGYQSVKFGTMSQTAPNSAKPNRVEKDSNDRPAVMGVLNLA